MVILGNSTAGGTTAVTVEQAVSGGWRGRAQQIVMLKAKVPIEYILICYFISFNR